MAVTHTIPATRGGRLFRRVLFATGILSIVGIADQLRALLRLAVLGPSGGGPGAVRLILLLAGWVILGWCGFRAFRRDALPPVWAALALPVLVWTYLLWPDG